MLDRRIINARQLTSSRIFFCLISIERINTDTDSADIEVSLCSLLQQYTAQGKMLMTKIFHFWWLKT